MQQIISIFQNKGVKMQQKICFLLMSDLAVEQRVNKLIALCIENKINIDVVHLPDANVATDSQDNWITIKLFTRNLPKNYLFWILKYVEYTFQAFIQLLRLRPTIIHCVDRPPIFALFLYRICRRVYVIYDSQEIWSGVNNPLNKPRSLWLFFEILFARSTDRIIVTDRHRRRILSEVLKVEKSKIMVLPNVPLIRGLKQAKSSVRHASKNLDKFLVVYAGALTRERQLEELIEAIVDTPKDWALVFVGFGDNSYIEELRKYAQSLGVSEKFSVLNAVPWNELVSYLRDADVGVAFYRQDSLNNKYCSPSKVYDYLLAGLQILSTDNPLIKDIAGEFSTVAALSEVNSSNITRALKSAFENRLDADNRSRQQARVKDLYAWENEEKKLVNLYDEFEGKP